jgi:hypothetical protein
MSSAGILYYNEGNKLLPRLLTSVHSLRKVYDGDICIITIGDESREIATKIANTYDCQLNDFISVQFADWVTTGKRIANRISHWKDHHPKMVEECLTNTYPSVNVGVYGFKKKCDFMDDWFDITIVNRYAPLPEEISCHLMNPFYKSKVMPTIYNCSCKFSKPDEIGAKIIHYHGRKHCYIDETATGKMLFNAHHWIKNWDEAYNNNMANVQEWWKDCPDRALRKFMKTRKKFNV